MAGIACFPPVSIRKYFRFVMKTISYRDGCHVRCVSCS